MELWIISSVLLAIVLQVAYTAVYRLYLSPLAKFPGPGLAALTSWYEFFYDIVKDGGGMYIWKVRDMHQKYGKSSSIYTMVCSMISIASTRPHRTC